MANGGRFSQVQAPVKVVHSNLDQEIIQITEDKLRLVLNLHLAKCEQRLAWVAPLGLLIAILTAFTTATFKDAFMLSAATWEAAFLIAALLSAAWLAKTAIAAFQASTVEDIVAKIKTSQQSIGPP